MKSIKINLNDVSAAVQELDDYQRSIDDKLHQVMEKLAEIGINVAKVGFANALYDGTNDTAVSDKPIWEGPNKVIIKATGASALFIEFGSGVYQPDAGYPAAYADQGVSARGTYGKGKGQRKVWGFYMDSGTTLTTGEATSFTNRRGLEVVLTRGNPANRCMYYAGRAIEEKIQDIVREVFSGD